MQVHDIDSILRNHGLGLKEEYVSSFVCNIVKDNGALSAEYVAEKIFSSMLHDDLNVVGSATLPSNLKKIHKMRLDGPFIVQVNEAVNVGEKVEQRHQDSPNRLLKLHITDGYQQAVAIEHAPIRCLSATLPVGYKLCLSDVSVRHGVLLLDTFSVQFLGGAVKSLGETSVLTNGGIDTGACAEGDSQRGSDFVGDHTRESAIGQSNRSGSVEASNQRRPQYQEQAISQQPVPPPQSVTTHQLHSHGGHQVIAPCINGSPVATPAYEPSATRPERLEHYFRASNPPSVRQLSAREERIKTDIDSARGDRNSGRSSSGSSSSSGTVFPSVTGQVSGALPSAQGIADTTRMGIWNHLSSRGESKTFDTTVMLLDDDESMDYNPTAMTELQKARRHDSPPIKRATHMTIGMNVGSHVQENHDSADNRSAHSLPGDYLPSAFHTIEACPGTTLSVADLLSPVGVGAVTRVREECDRVPLSLVSDEGDASIVTDKTHEELKFSGSDEPDRAVVLYDITDSPLAAQKNLPEHRDFDDGSRPMEEAVLSIDDEMQLYSQVPLPPHWNAPTEQPTCRMAQRRHDIKDPIDQHNDDDMNDDAAPPRHVTSRMQVKTEARNHLPSGCSPQRSDYWTGRCYIDDIQERAATMIKQGADPCADAVNGACYIEGEVCGVVCFKLLKGNKELYVLVNFNDKGDNVWDIGRSERAVQNSDRLTHFPVVRVSSQLCESVIQMSPQEFYDEKGRCESEQDKRNYIERIVSKFEGFRGLFRYELSRPSAKFDRKFIECSPGPVIVHLVAHAAGSRK